jgi:endonuclease/exonuclease/phosphatase (EEP) superfamily protein YafD
MEIRGALLALALIVVVALIGVHVPIGIPGQPILENLRFHSASLLLLLSFFLLFSGARWRAGLFALVALASVGQGLWVVAREQSARPPAEALAGLPTISVLHFNMLASNTANGAAIADMVSNSGADFAFLPEAVPVQPFLPELRKTYIDQIGCTAPGNCDLLFLSRYKLSDIKVHSLSKFSQNRVFTAYADIAGSPVAIVAVHLTKPYFDEAARGEIVDLAQVLKTIKGPVIIAGDFNAAAWSSNLEELLRWAKLVPAPYYPATWPPDAHMLGVPLDNIFTRAPAIISEIAPLPDALGSNHRGLTAKVVILPGS